LIHEGEAHAFVIPAKAGIHLLLPEIKMDSGYRRNDEGGAARVDRA